MIEANPQWTDSMVTAIEQGKVKLGMTPEMVKASIGSPLHINETRTKYGSSFQLVYPSHPSNMYVYIENGKVTGIQR